MNPTQTTNPRPETLTHDLSAFFETNPLAIKAAHSIKNGAEIALTVADVPYTFTKESGRNKLLARPAAKPDMAFQIPEKTAQDLVTKNFGSVGDVGLFLFEEVMSGNPERKIHVKFHCGFLTLLGSGYLGVLTAGGADVAKYLAGKGFANFNKLRDVVSRLRS